MQSIQDIVSGPPVSNYTGSEATRNMVAEQIKARWGSSELEKYDPYKNTLPFVQWLKLGYRVKKGEKALKSVTFVEKKDAQGNIIKKFPRKVNLFYYRSVEPITN